MTQVNHISLHADETGTLELVCERSVSDERDPAVRSFSSKGQFGILVDDLSPNETVTLFFDADLEDGAEGDSEDAFENDPDDDHADGADDDSADAAEDDRPTE
jgi:hypothetical protein